MPTETTRLHQREPQVVARDTAYAVTAIADDAFTTVSTRFEQLREAPARAKELRSTAPERIRSLPEDAQSTIEERRARIESQLTDIRERAQQDADERLARFEARFDAKAAEGAERVSTLRDDERVVRITDALEPVGDQLKVARSQVKGAVTSIRKTVDAAFDAGRTQADAARSQVKGAVTSSRKTVDVAVDAARGIAS